MPGLAVKGRRALMGRPRAAHVRPLQRGGPGAKKGNFMELTEILRIAVNEGASDVFIVAGLPLTFKINGHQDRRAVGAAHVRPAAFP